MPEERTQKYMVILLHDCYFSYYGTTTDVVGLLSLALTTSTARLRYQRMLFCCFFPAVCVKIVFFLMINWVCFYAKREWFLTLIP